MKPTDDTPFSLPEEAQEAAKQQVLELFRLMREQSQRMAEDLARFNEKFQQNQETIQRGVRRTSGRIV